MTSQHTHKMSTSTSGAWKDSDGSIVFRSGVKDGSYTTIESNIKRIDGVVKKKDGHPFGAGPSVEEWAEKVGVPKAQMLNKVRKCGGCGKPNAYTLTDCNSCGVKLPEEITHTPNLFMCIVYGFDAVGLSLRHQDENLLVIDDLLSLSACHINSIWSREHIPDMRSLFINPKRGLSVVKAMYDATKKVFLEQFASNKKFISDHIKNPPEDLLSCIACGFNTPPSQYQLHLQFIMLPILPFQAAQFLRGVHFTKYRFVPINYTIDALETLAATDKKFAPETELSVIVEAVKEINNKIDYETYWNALFEHCESIQSKHSNWSADNFTSELKADDDSATAAANTDKLLLQSYGRPYVDDKFCANNHYAFAREPGSVETFC